MALAAKRNKYGLFNFTVIVDYNKMQAMGTCEEGIKETVAWYKEKILDYR